MGKLSTPDWIKEGFNSKEEYEKQNQRFRTSGDNKKEKGIKSKKKAEKSFKIRICPKCGSDKVSVVLNGEEGQATGEWECKNCHWKGRDIKEKELNEEEFMKYLDENGAEVM